MWVLVATVGLAPALIAVLMVMNVVVAPFTWWRGPTAEADEVDDEPSPAGHRRAAWIGGLAVGIVELALVAGLGAMVGRPPWFVAGGAAIGAGVVWALVFVRIPPYAGFSVAPAVVAASIGGGVGALVVSGVLWGIGG